MGSKSSPSAPTPIDPTAVINAQAAANRVNQVTPYGSLNWSKDANGNWTQTTNLSQAQQQLLNQGQLTSETALANLKTKPMQLQTGVNAPQFNKVTNNGVPVQSLGPSGNIQSQLDFSGVPGIPQANNAAYNQAVNSAYGQATSRLNPQWNQAQTQIETQLADQGIPQNSDAWNKAMTQFQQGKNDAYNTAFNSAVGNGLNTENTLFGMGLQANQAGVGNALASGNFANQAQGQQYGQNLSSGQFADQAAAQRLNQELQSYGFNNQANQQGFQDAMSNANLNNSAEAQRIQQYLSETGLTNQYGNLNAPNTSGSNVDVLGANSLMAQQQMAAYQAQLQSNNAKNGGMGSLLGTLGGAWMMSDRRTKRDIERIGELNGLPIYSFRYAWDKKKQIGLMAQDVEKKRPHAVITIGGIKHVDYQKALAA